MNDNISETNVKAEMRTRHQAGESDTRIIDSFFIRGLPVYKATEYLNDIKAEAIQVTNHTPIYEPFSSIQTKSIPLTIQETDENGVTHALVYDSIRGEYVQPGHEAKNASESDVNAPTSGLNASGDITLPGVEKSAPDPLKGFSDEITTLGVNGRSISVAMVVDNPRVIVFDNVLTDEECDQIIAYASPKLEHSKVVNHGSGESVLDHTRTSSGTSLSSSDFPFTSTLMELTESLLDWPVDKIEGYQVLHYSVGEYFTAHYDHFSADSAYGKDLAGKGQGNRCATLLFYLNDVDVGGATRFTNAGISIMPKKGRALFFAYPDPDHAENVMHAGQPPEAGEKWVAATWMRQKTT